MDEFKNFEKEEFQFGGKNAIVVFADKAAGNDKWLLKTEYFGAFPELELMMLKAGYNVAHVDNESRWCLDSDTQRQADFCKYLHEKYGFAKQCVPVGMSCGGMQAIFLAARFPEVVAAMYLDAPVINFLSCPGNVGKGKIDAFDEFERERHMSLIDLMSFRKNPLDYFSKLLDKKPPIILVSGDSDTIVPFDENGKLLYNFYIEHGCDIELHMKKGADHHPHGMADNAVIAEFIKKHY